MEHVNEVFSLENTKSKTNVNINVTLSDSVTNINSDAFFGCTNLKIVNYKGTQEQWEQIAFPTDTNATINYNYTGE